MVKLKHLYLLSAMNYHLIGTIAGFCFGVWLFWVHIAATAEK